MMQWPARSPGKRTGRQHDREDGVSDRRVIWEHGLYRLWVWVLVALFALNATDYFRKRRNGSAIR